MFSSMMLNHCFARNIHVRFHVTRTCTHIELRARKDSRSNEHRHLPGHQHQPVIRATSDTVAKKSLAFEGATACREEDRSNARCKAELLLECKFRGMWKGAENACWWGWRNQDDGLRADEDFQLSILEKTDETAGFLHAESKVYAYTHPITLSIWSFNISSLLDLWLLFHIFFTFM